MITSNAFTWVKDSSFDTSMDNKTITALFLYCFKTFIVIWRGMHRDVIVLNVFVTQNQVKTISPNSTLGTAPSISITDISLCFYVSVKFWHISKQSLKFWSHAGVLVPTIPHNIVGILPAAKRGKQIYLRMCT